MLLASAYYEVHYTEWSRIYANRIKTFIDGWNSVQFHWINKHYIAVIVQEPTQVTSGRDWAQFNNYILWHISIARVVIVLQIVSAFVTLTSRAGILLPGLICMLGLTGVHSPLLL
jgi:hypothetical protein